VPEPDRAEEHDERGWARYQPTGHTHPNQAEPPTPTRLVRMVMITVRVVTMIVAMMMIVAMPMIVGVVMGRRPAAEGGQEHGDTEGGDEDAARDAEPAQDHLAGEAGGRGEQQAEDQDTAGVGEGHDRADDKGVTRAAVPAGEVGRHYGLAVSWERGVPGAERERQSHREHADQRGEAVADEPFQGAVSTRDPAADRISALQVGLRTDGYRSVARIDPQPSRTLIERRAEQVGWVSAQLVRY
jgi:hypothetical protein